jgi:tetratricopeptide (TPR) repeat protein
MIIMLRYFILLVGACAFINLQAQDEDDMLEMGIRQFALKDYVGSIETFNSLIKINPQNKKEAYHYKALAKFFLGDYRGAQADMKIARELGAKYQNRAFKVFLDEEYKRKLIIKQF